jgi:hypothetical protein
MNLKTVEGHSSDRLGRRQYDVQQNLMVLGYARLPVSQHSIIVMALMLRSEDSQGQVVVPERTIC